MHIEKGRDRVQIFIGILFSFGKAQKRKLNSSAQKPLCFGLKKSLSKTKFKSSPKLHRQKQRNCYAQTRIFAFRLETFGVQFLLKVKLKVIFLWSQDLACLCRSELFSYCYYNTNSSMYRNTAQKRFLGDYFFLMHMIPMKSSREVGLSRVADSYFFLSFCMAFFWTLLPVFLFGILQSSPQRYLES